MIKSFLKIGIVCGAVLAIGACIVGALRIKH